MTEDGQAARRLRAEMVAHLRRHAGLSDERVAGALGQVPRHLFVPAAELDDAYGDQAIPTHFRHGVACSSASQPAIVATMLEQLSPPGGGSVLEVGAGTGYNAALLSVLVSPGGRVVTVDIEAEVVDEARAHLSRAGVSNVEVIHGDGASGWVEGAPYDGIIVTAGSSDIAPAWFDQLGAGGRLVMPLSIRGVQHCVALAPADGHLRSVAICECGFMPLTGTMANSDQSRPVPAHDGVYLIASSGLTVDPAVVGWALDRPLASRDLGVRASVKEVFGSLRRWLALHEPAAATLTYIGPPEAADRSGVPQVVVFPGPGVAQRSSPCLLGEAGFAVLDVVEPGVGDADSFLNAMLDLAVRRQGDASGEAARLAELVGQWDAAGRPGVDRLRIDAYPTGSEAPADGGIVHRARHTTFVLTTA
ncbi:MAG TPA: methyltransferase domain-containing protein [Acidimicrobiales bacterium]|jgi:protein-L-isoaspartate(D-aspartate) O-methyltransferase|nr:methyltransferase domain-containing protein [Acidimicrobiales bacterium]